VCVCSFGLNLGLVVPNFGYKGVGQLPTIGLELPEIGYRDFMYGNKANLGFHVPDILQVPRLTRCSQWEPNLGPSGNQT
jgi:hypothetical protein